MHLASSATSHFAYFQHSATKAFRYSSPQMSKAPGSLQMPTRVCVVLVS